MNPLDLILPRHCAGCGTPNTAWCQTCKRSTEDLRQVERTGLNIPVYTLAPYAGPARRLVITYKDRHRRDLAPVMGHALADALHRLADRDPTWTADPWLVPAPSRTATARRRGGNHMARAVTHTCRELARTGTRAHLAPALRMAARTRDSVGLAPGERVANLRGALTVHPPGAPPPGTPVVLVDDVVTTGATLAACVHALAEADIPVAAALVFTATV